MVKVLTYIRVIRFEGVSALTSCEVYQDAHSIESLLPIISEKRILIEEASIYQVKAFSGHTEYSVSFPSTLLDEDGMFWLPLFQSSDDFIENQLEDVNEPRVLILVHKKTVEEGKSQLVTEESAHDYEFMPEIKLDYSENPYSSQEICPETPLLQLKSVETTEELPSSELSNEKMLEISIHYQETLNTHKRFTEKILQDLDEKNSQLSNAFNEISALNSQVRRLESENNYLRAMNNGFITAQISQLVSQLELLKSKEKQNETEKLPNQGQLETLIKAECEKFNIEPVVKDDEEVFVLNGKKFLMSLKNGKVVCRTGSIYKDFRQVLIEGKTENKPFVTNSKSPFRKNLVELNSSIDTPRSSSRLNENSLNGKPKKIQGLKRIGQLKKVV